MRVFIDIFSGDELVSDTYPMKVVDDIILEFTGKYEVRKEGDVQLDGANPSAEDEIEGSDENVESGVDIVLNHRLQDMTGVFGDLKQFKQYIKEYMTKLSKKLKEEGMKDEELTAWKGKMSKWAAEVLKKDRFKDMSFYSGPGDEAAEGQLGILEYRSEDGGDEKPIMMFIKAGLRDEKC